MHLNTHTEKNQHHENVEIYNKRTKKIKQLISIFNDGAPNLSPFITFLIPLRINTATLHPNILTCFTVCRLFF